MINVHISGFVPVSLIDFPSKISSVIFTHGCNLRCRYCHNPELVTGKAAENHLDDFLSHLQESETEGVAVSGGEPLCSCGIVNLLSEIKKAGHQVKLDTNGSLPAKLNEVCELGLVDFVSVDLKGFNDADMSYITRHNYPLKSFYKSIETLESYGIAYEIRHTLWKIPDKLNVEAFFRHGLKGGLILQFPLKKGQWLDKRFNVSFSDEERGAVREIFDGYSVSYRNE